MMVALLLAGVAPAQGGKDDPLKTDEQRSGYALGMSVGGNLLRQGVEVEFDAFFRGIRDAMEQNKPLLDEQEIREAVAWWQANRPAARSLLHDNHGSMSMGERGGTCKLVWATIFIIFFMYLLLT